MCTCFFFATWVFKFKVIGLSCVLVKLKSMSIDMEFLPKKIPISDLFAQAYRNSTMTRDLKYYTWITRS